MLILFTIFIIFAGLICATNLSITNDNLRWNITLFFTTILFFIGLFMVDNVIKLNNKNKENEVILLKNNLAEITTSGSIIIK